MKVLVIGAGGIGSFFLRTLKNLQNAGQFKGNLEVVVYDPDTIEEKNITYQDFEIEEIGLDKVEAMAERHGFPGICELVTITELQAEEPDIIVSAVDNTVTRKLVLDYWYETDVYFIDLRAEGRTVSFFTPGKGQRSLDDKEKRRRYAAFVSSLPKEEVEDGSCQLAFELNKGVIQLGNQIIGPIGAQLLLNYSRSVADPAEFIHRF